MRRLVPWLIVGALAVGVLCVFWLAKKPGVPILKVYEGPTQTFHPTPLFSPRSGSAMRPFDVTVSVPTFIRNDDQFVLYTGTGAKVRFSVWRGRVEPIDRLLSGQVVRTVINMNGWSGAITEERGGFILGLKPDVEVRDVVAGKAPDWFFEAKVQWPKDSIHEQEVVENTLSAILQSL